MTSTHHLQVVEDGRDLLHSLDHLLRCIGIFSFSCHLLIQRHLPAHGRIVHLVHEKRETGAIKKKSLLKLTVHAVTEEDAYLSLEMKVVLQELSDFFVCVSLSGVKTRHCPEKVLMRLKKAEKSRLD